MNFTSISSIVLAEEAEKLGLKVIVISEEKNLFYVKSDSKEILFKSTDFGINTSLGLKITDDKELSHHILKRKGIPMTNTWHLEIKDMKELERYELSFPVIIKPINEAHGNGVMMNILDIEELKKKLIQSFENYKRMIVQKQVQGKEYRLLVLMGKVILSINRVPASVLGDGEKNIGELIKCENKNNTLRGVGYSNGLTDITIDNELTSYITKQGMTLEFVPMSSQIVQLRGTSNIGTGGTMIDVSDKVSDDIKELACKSAEILGLGIAGVDIITSDITKSLEETGGILLEVNETPGLGGDRELTGVNTGKVILEKLFF